VLDIIPKIIEVVFIEKKYLHKINRCKGRCKWVWAIYCYRRGRIPSSPPSCRMFIICNIIIIKIFSTVLWPIEFIYYVCVRIILQESARFTIGFTIVWIRRPPSECFRKISLRFIYIYTYIGVSSGRLPSNCAIPDYNRSE